MTADQIVKQLRTLGSESTKRVLLKHRIPEPLLGVKIEELKKIQKKIKKDYQLALDLYETGIYDARYLAGLIADESKMTRKNLQGWVKSANCDALCGFTVAWVAAESPHGMDLALEWIESPKERIAATGWSTLSGIVALRDDSDLDLPLLKKLLQRVGETIHQQSNSVRYVMNSFVISTGSYVKSLTDFATQIGKKIGPVEVDMGDTACKVPFAPDYIKKVKDRGTIGKKRKTVRC
jgi:3-methyladenine DNA glycosylase AlkD